MMHIQLNGLPLRTWLGGVLLLALSLPSSTRAHSPSEFMARAAGHFLETLSADQRKKATYEMKDAERQNWHFIPKTRNGLPLKEMNPEQREMAHILLVSGLSHRGYAEALQIMSLEKILYDLENQSPKRDPAMYHFTIFGTPSPKGTWAWRVEGHHLSLNFTFVNGIVAGTPSFLGTNPAEVREGPRKGLRVLSTEEDLARKLVTSLPAPLLRQAVIADKAPRDIYTSAEVRVKPLEAKGVPYGKLNADQQSLVWTLIETYVGRLRPELAAADLKKIESHGRAGILFAWAGSLERGEGHYYRIQGPSFLLEYDNVQNGANHIHAVWRDFENDFGGDLLRRHYQEVPHP